MSENKINEDFKLNDIDIDIDNNNNNELSIEDNYDDINTIIKKIDFNNIKNNPDDDIFTNDYVGYKNYCDNFNKIFNDFIKGNVKKAPN